MKKEESIKDTLEVIRKALEDDNTELDNDILILNRKVNHDGTINIIRKEIINSYEINNIIDQKLTYILENKFDKWLEKKLPEILDKYIKNKN